jgi:hypothetical protein
MRIKLIKYKEISNLCIKKVKLISTNSIKLWINFIYQKTKMKNLQLFMEKKIYKDICKFKIKALLKEN